MCSQEIIIRDAEPRDERRIVDLLIKIFSGWPAWNVESPLMHWRWKFRDNPVHARNFVVAENRDEIIGVFGLLSHRLKIKDRARALVITKKYATSLLLIVVPIHS
jgi:hypothetical protein